MGHGSLRRVLRFHCLWQGLVVLLLTFAPQPTVAKSCGDVAPGAKLGSSMDPNEFTPEFFEKYGDACVIQWVGGTRGGAGRAADKRKCINLPGAQFERFIPDSGSNYNTCIFRIAGSGAGTPGNEEPVPDETPIPPIPSVRPTPSGQTRSSSNDHGTYQLTVCNKTGQPFIWVAVALFDHPDDDNLTIHAWWKVADGDCVGPFTRSLGRYASHTIAVHADSKRFMWWRAGRGHYDLCVDPSGPYTRRNTPGYRCSSSEKLRGFGKFKVFAGKNTYNFRP